MSPRLPPTRRQCHRLLLALVAAAHVPLAACASPASGRSITLSPARLNELLNRRFPLRRDFSGLAELSLQSPRLQLLPSANRLATQLELVLTERLTGSRTTGRMDLDYALRFDAAEGAIRMVDVKVNRLDVDQVPPAQRALLAQYAPRAAERLMNGALLYRVPAEQLEMAHTQGWRVQALRVLPEGLRIELGPAA